MRTCALAPTVEEQHACLGSAKPVRKVPFSQLFKRVGKPAWPIVHLFLSSERAS